ncbi:MAG: phospholipase D family protein, partial [Methylococcales bacterium]
VKWLKPLAALYLLVSLSACSHLSKEKRVQADNFARQHRDSSINCQQDDACAIKSPLYDLADQANRESTDISPKHAVVLLDRGQDSLVARLHLIHSAKKSIELQTFIFEQDDTGQLTLQALMDAAKRGVKVRVLLDQQFGLADPNLQAYLASYHDNFELRLYNPLFDEARTQKLEFVAGIFFTFKKLNQRMHSKLLLVDDKVAVIGGRNIEDRYFDWSGVYNYRDRDLLIAGPVAKEMEVNFEAFWGYRKSLPPTSLKDVAQRLISHEGPPDIENLFLAKPLSARAAKMNLSVHDSAGVMTRLGKYLVWVNEVDFLADLPSKHNDHNPGRAEASLALYDLVSNSQQEIIMQTPYLVMSRPARKVFRTLHRKKDSPKIIISTNSLAATDAFPVYAMSHKYKRMYLRELGFFIHEFKPFPVSAPFDMAAMMSDEPSEEGMPILGSGSSGSASGAPPLKRAGVRVGLHAKSMVVDGHIAVVGSHNFDPRSDDFNTESLVIIPDKNFAQALAASIHRDMLPENAWTIAPRPKPPILSGLNYNLGKLSEKLPIFDIWPFPYATSYELKDDCQPVPFTDKRFMDCYEQVGDFPEVDLTLKAVYTRMVTAFGAGLVPIL